MSNLEIKQNSLLFCNPKLAKEYDNEKNSIPLSAIRAQSAKKVWWICSGCGYSFLRAPNQRNYLNNDGTRRSKGLLLESCPRCSAGNHTSFREQAIYYYIKKYFPDAINSYRCDWLGKKELDIFIPSLNIAIEYDGESWHKNTSKDMLKSKLCKENGIELIRMREEKCPRLNDNTVKIKIKNNSYAELEKGLSRLLFILGVTEFKEISIDVSRDSQKIQKQYKFKKIENSIFSNKKLLKEFSPNNLISPENISLRSNFKYLWVCSKGHEYEMSPDSKANSKGCPYCSNKRILKGYNDVATTDPKILEVWDYSKNTNISPYDFTRGSRHKIWWKCHTCGDSGYRSIYHIINGNTCPHCELKNGNIIPVICMETGISYKSIVEASCKTNIHKVCIGDCCRGKQKTAGGYTWKYLKEVTNNEQKNNDRRGNE